MFSFYIAAAFYAGAFAPVLNAIGAGEPRPTYAALWLDIVSRRSKVTAHSASHLANRYDEMAGAVIRLCLAQLTPAAVLAQPTTLTSHKTRPGLRGELLYRELTLDKGARGEATRLLRLAAADAQKLLYIRGQSRSSPWSLASSFTSFPLLTPSTTLTSPLFTFHHSHPTSLLPPPRVYFS